MIVIKIWVAEHRNNLQGGELAKGRRKEETIYYLYRMCKQTLLLLLMIGILTKQNAISEEGKGGEAGANERKFSKFIKFGRIMQEEDRTDENKFSGQFEAEVGEKKMESFSEKFLPKINQGAREGRTSWAQNYVDTTDYDEDSLYDYDYYDDFDGKQISDLIVNMCQWRFNSTNLPETSCDCQQNGTTLVCCSSHLPQKICEISDQDVNDDITHLYILGLAQPFIDLNQQFVEKLKILPGNLRDITLRSTNVAILNICDNQEDEFCQNLTSLDLRNNQIISLDLPNIPKLENLYLSGNNWQCIHQESFPEEGQNLEWLLDRKWMNRWKDEAQTNCSSEMMHGGWKNNLHERDGWFDEVNPQEAPNLKKFLNFMKVMRRDCPFKCDCRRKNAKVTTVKGKDKKEIFIVRVSCYSLNLTSLPRVLPPKTIFLDVSENQISDLSNLVNNRHYEDLRILNLENNQITSMEPLRNSKLEQINLRDNQLSYLDLNLLEPILEYQSTRPKNEHELNLWLSDNPWSCQCSHIKMYQNFLVKYNVLLKDAKDIVCIEYDALLVDLDYDELCAIKMDGMYILIALEVFLLISILLKLAYDILMYHRTGHLPWVARHLCCSALSSSTWWAEHTETGQWWVWTQTSTLSLTRRQGEAATPCSSGYITSSGASSHTGAHGHKDATVQTCKIKKDGGSKLAITDTRRTRENSVVRFL